MRERLTPGGLRGRLLVAFVVTSMITLAVVAAIVLGPLQRQLRDQSVETLNDALVASVPEFQDALRTPFEEDTLRFQRVSDASVDLRNRVDTRVLLDADDDNDTLPTFYYDSDFTPSTTQDATIAALTAIREDRAVTTVEGDQVTIALHLRNGAPEPDGVLVAQRRLTEVAAAANQVRNALLAGAGVGLLVAIALAITLSGTLLRRLARLRTAALRITKEGPDAPAPRDTGRDEVGDLALALARMQEELRRQEAARRSFVSTASHELRTPLTMLQGTMELLEDDLRAGRLDKEDGLRQVETARLGLNRLSTLAGELLDLSRLDAAVPLRTEPVELGEIVRAVAAEFELRAERRDTPIEVALPANACWGRGDPDAIARVARILLDNALRYGPPATPVRVAAHADHGQAVITVADAGPGIPAAERERIFERFHRGSAAGSAGGFGLGLAIGRELARRMGGELALDDAGVPGTRFALTLRSTRSPAEDPRAGRDRVSA